MKNCMRSREMLCRMRSLALNSSASRTVAVGKWMSSCSQ